MERPKRMVKAMSITPFGIDGQLDEGACRHHFERLANAGVDMYIGGSSPGQGYTLSKSEAFRLLAIAKESSGGRVKVMASGFEPRTAAQLIEFSRVVTDAGLDGMQLYSLDIGHGGRPSPLELEAYFRTLLSSIQMPTVLSSHVAMGYLIPVELIETLIADHPQIVGVNVNTPDLAYLSSVVSMAQRASSPVEVYIGSVQLALSALALGADGFLSAEANICPRLARSVVTYFEAGDFDALTEAYRRLCMVSPILGFGTATRGVKCAMKLLKLPGHHLREPLLPLPVAEEMVVAACLDKARIHDGDA